MPCIRVFFPHGAGLDEHLPAHAQVHQQAFGRGAGKLKPQVLASPAGTGDLRVPQVAAHRVRGSAVPNRPLVKNLDIVDPAAYGVRVQPPADDLDLRKLRHRRPA